MVGRIRSGPYFDCFFFVANIYFGLRLPSLWDCGIQYSLGSPDGRLTHYILVSNRCVYVP